MISASYILDQTLDMSLSSSSTFSLSNDIKQIQHKSHQICMSTLVACLLIVLSSSELLRSSKHSACRHNALVIAKLYEIGVLPISKCYIITIIDQQLYN